MRALFSPQPGTTYLDTATYGLPPRPTVEAMTRAIDAWRSGTADWLEDWDRPAESARADFARLLGVPPARVSLVPAASVGVGAVAAALGPGDEVVVGDDEFTSLLFPLLVAEREGAVVRQVPSADLPGAIGIDTRLVAFSLVKMQTGRVAHVEEVIERAEKVGARVLVDATHGVPFVPLGHVIERVDFLVCAAYKHLLCPRGVAFLVVGPDRRDEVVPWHANWRAADDPYGRYFGGPLTLGSDGSGFDVSLAWFPWVGAVRSLRLLVEWADIGLLSEPPRLAAELADAVGVEWGGASLVCVPTEHPGAIRTALDMEGVKAAVVGGSVRMSTHVYNDSEDVERAARVVSRMLSAAR